MNFLRNLFKNKSASPPNLNRFSLGVLVGVLCTVLVLGPVSVSAGVSDNSGGFLSEIAAFLGFGKESITPSKDQFSTASLVEKVNYLEGANRDLTTKLDNQAETIDRLFSMSVSTAYTDSQVKSTKATVLSPKQVLLQWDLTNTDDCTTAGSSASALGDWTIIEKFNVYYGTSSRTSDMTLVKTIEVNSSKAFYDDYSYQFNGLSPNVQYYFWVTSVVEGGTQLSGSSAVRALRTPTLASAQATGLTLTPTGKYSMRVSWNAVPYSGYQYYRVYYSTSPLSVSMATTPNTTTSSNSVTLTGLTLGATYYVGVCAVLNDGNVWVGGLANGTNYSSKLQCKAIDFSTASWADIAEYTKAGLADDVFTVGQTKTVATQRWGDITSRPLRLVDISDSGKTITCMFTSFESWMMNYWTDNTTGSWDSTEIRQDRLSVICNSCLSSELTSVVTPIDVVTGIWNNDSAVITTIEKFWLPSEVQIFGSQTYSTTAEARTQRQFQYFANGGNKALAGGNYTSYWLRSPYRYGNSNFCVGTSTYDGSSASSGLDGIGASHYYYPCFTIK